MKRALTNPTPAGLHQSPRGFTLIEMMLAIGILGLILSMLATSFNVVAHSKVHGEGRLDANREGRTLVWRMANEIRGAVQTPVALSHVMFVGLGRFGNGGPIDTISLCTLDAGHGRSLTGGNAESLISYNIVPNPAHNGWFLLQRSQQSGLLFTPGRPAYYTIADNLISLHIRYFDGERWAESWDSSSLPRGRQVPIAVALQLQMGSPSGGSMEFGTQVTVPMGIAQW
jgi:prepilin-type N-terminal cleavage/methylation domain-containing protein